LAIALADDGRTLATVGEKGDVDIWDITTRSRLTRLASGFPAMSVAFSPEGCLAVGSTRVAVWNVGEKKLIMEKTTKIAIGPTNVNVWDDKLKTFVAQQRTEERIPAVSLAFSPDGKRLAVGYTDAWIRVWDVTKNELVLALRGHESSVTSIAYSPDGKSIASGGSDGTVRVWNAASGAMLYLMTDHAGVVSSVKFSASGHIVASGSWDNSIIVWDLERQLKVKVLRGHKDGVCSVAFSPNGEFLASGSWDRTVRVWSVDKGVEMYRYVAKDAVSDILFSKDGKNIIVAIGDVFATGPFANAGTESGTIHIWPVPRK
jgi:uncharacterized protein with WD repeat